MNKAVLVLCALTTWILLIVFHQIENTTGTRIDLLLYAAGVSMLFMFANIFRINKYE